LQAHYEEFRARGAEVWAISSSTVEEHRKLAEKRGITFPILSDREGKAMRAYGVLHPGAPPYPDLPTARPAEFLVDAGGTIRARLLTDNWRVRARPENLLALLDRK
jgi:peroxiredoxin Q/BCP